MGKHIYGAIIRPSDEGGFWAEVPDLPGCFGQGRDYMATIESIANGIETHLAALIECGMPIPAAGPVLCDDGGEVVYVYADDNTRLGLPTVPAAEAARMLGVSKPRISQLIAEGRLTAERLASGTNVTIESIEHYKNSPRKAGRPKRGAVPA